MKIGQILLKQNAITTDQLAISLWVQKVWGGTIGRIMLSRGYVKEEQLLNALSYQLEIPVVHLGDRLIPETLMESIPMKICETNLLIPFGVDPETGVLMVAMADPLDSNALEMCYSHLKKSIRIYLVGFIDITNSMWINNKIHSKNGLSLNSDVMSINEMVVEEFEILEESHITTNTVEITDDEILQEIPVGIQQSEIINVDILESDLKPINEEFDVCIIEEHQLLNKQNNEQIGFDYNDNNGEFSKRSQITEEDISGMEDLMEDEISNMEDFQEEELSDIEDYFDESISDIEELIEEMSDIEDLIEEEMSDIEDLIEEENSDIEDLIEEEMSDIEDLIEEEVSDIEDLIEEEISDIEDLIEEELSFSGDFHENNKSDNDLIGKNNGENSETSRESGYVLIESSDCNIIPKKEKKLTLALSSIGSEFTDLLDDEPIEEIGNEESGGEERKIPQKLGKSDGKENKIEKKSKLEKEKKRRKKKKLKEKKNQQE
jgi:MshEN domain